ncbi:hypothetical protein GCM10027568_14700 [Humibacter soli]
MKKIAPGVASPLPLSQSGRVTSQESPKAMTMNTATAGHGTRVGKGLGSVLVDALLIGSVLIGSVLIGSPLL